VIRDLTPNAVILDGAQYHHIQPDKPCYTARGSAAVSLPKKEKKKDILPMIPKEKPYRIDRILLGTGHTVV
jgi:hypothetical protein